MISGIRTLQAISLHETQVRCYGFGAVLEEFEVRDALESVFYAKQEMIL